MQWWLFTLYLFFAGVWKEPGFCQQHVAKCYCSSLPPIIPILSLHHCSMLFCCSFFLCKLIVLVLPASSFPTQHLSVCEQAVVSILSFVCQIFFRPSIAQLVPALCLFKFAFVPLLLWPRLYAVLLFFGWHSHFALDQLITFWICSCRPWLICSFPGWAPQSS